MSFLQKYYVLHFLKLLRPLPFSDVNLKILFINSIQEELNAMEAKHISNFDKENGINSLQFLGGLGI